MRWHVNIRGVLCVVATFTLIAVSVDTSASDGVDVAATATEASLQPIGEESVGALDSEQTCGFGDDFGQFKLKIDALQKQAMELAQKLEEEDERFSTVYELLRLKTQQLERLENEMKDDDRDEEATDAHQPRQMLQQCEVRLEKQLRSALEPPPEPAADALQPSEHAPTKPSQASEDLRTCEGAIHAQARMHMQTVADHEKTAASHVATIEQQKAELGRLREQLSKQWRAVKMSKAAPQSCAASQPGSTAADTGAEPTASAYLVDAAHADVFPRSAQTLAVRAGMQDNLTSEMWGAADLLELREEARRMFFHGFDKYMAHAYPLDELAPLSCSGKNIFGHGTSPSEGYALTLIDALDTLAVMGEWTKFAQMVGLAKDISFDIDVNVSVFETNIRAIGGLLSAHMLALKFIGASYGGELLGRAVDLADRLLPAFSTPTGIPYGTVNLRHGVPPGESTIASAAGAGTITLEFVFLSKLTSDQRYANVARRAVDAIWKARSNLNLVGSHIDILTGQWTQLQATLGTNVDSFYEYLLKSQLLFGDDFSLHAFHTAYTAIVRHLKKGPWYIDVHMSSAETLNPVFSSLSSFWPGIQVLVGDIERAVETQFALYSIWRTYGGIPEAFNLESGNLQAGSEGYPLRPEAIESVVYLYRATKDPIWLSLGRDMLTSLQQLNRVECGYAAIRHLSHRDLEDRMDSYFLSETVKYLYLLFDTDNFIFKDSYVFNTEAHPLPVVAEFREENTGVQQGVCAMMPYRRRLAAYGFDSQSVAYSESARPNGSIRHASTDTDETKLKFT